MTQIAERLKHYGRMIRDERRRILLNIESLHEEFGGSVSDNTEENGLETHLGDQGTMTFLRERDLTIEENEERILQDMDAALIRIKDGAELRRRVSDVVDAKYRKDILASIADTPDDELQKLISNLGGHDLTELIRVFNEADAVEHSPAVIFAYTVKGWGLPMAGDPLNHSQLLNQAQIDILRDQNGLTESGMWDAVDPSSPAGELCIASAERLRDDPKPGQVTDPSIIPATLKTRNPGNTSTQEALGRTLARVAEEPELGKRVVTMSPDVATSTHLSGWINKVGVFAPEIATDYEQAGPKLLKWEPSPSGQHIELGISEMNLFMALGQFGLSYELTGQHLIPVGTVYDPFVCRGLDALIYDLYVGSKMIFAGTPAGVSLSPEGGAHQSAVTPSLGIELPNVVFYEPAFANEVEWILLEGMRRCCDRKSGLSTYLRLSTKSIEQNLNAPALKRLGEDTLREHVLKGGYRLIDHALDAPGLDPRDTVQILVGGIMVPEALEAASRLHAEGVAANVIVVTSSDLLFEALRRSRRALLKNANAPLELGHVETLIPINERKAPTVTIQDGASHSLAFLGSIFGVPVVPLGVDEFGQSASRADLYHAVGIDADQIVNAAMLALELA